MFSSDLTRGKQVALGLFSLYYTYYNLLNARDHVMQPKQTRLAKAMSDAGCCSRREAEKLIIAGKVLVNNLPVTTPAFNVTEADMITVSGEILRTKDKPRLWLYHKPAGLVTTHSDPQNRPTVFQNLPKNLPRLISVGRLDLNSEGLLLLTNSGDLARQLELPSNKLVRVYKVRAYGEVRIDALSRATHGIKIDGCYYKPSSIKLLTRSSKNSRCLFFNGNDGLYTFIQRSKITLNENI